MELVNFFQGIQKFLGFVCDFVNPKSAYSWKAFVLLALFSWFMSLLAIGWIHGFIDSLGWIFFIIGITWACSVNSLKITPWITSALICWFIFGDLLEGETATGLIVFPVLAAVIASMPYFWDGEKLKSPSPQERQKMVILFGTQFLLSCWFQFYFLIQSWLRDYPSLLVDDFSDSTFVVLVRQSPVTPRGVVILEEIGNKIEESLDGKSWGEVERWLLEAKRQANLEALQAQVTSELIPLAEDSLWHVTSEAKTEGSGYILELQAIWLGPGLQPKVYSSQKSCTIMPVFPSQDTLNSNSLAFIPNEVSAVAEVRCDPAFSDTSTQLIK